MRPVADTICFILSDPSHQRIRVCPVSEGIALPQYRFESPREIALLDTPELERLAAIPGGSPGRLLFARDVVVAGRTVVVAAFESTGAESDAGEPHWLDRDACAAAPLLPDHRPIVEAWWREGADGGTGHPTPWVQPGWYAEAEEWVRAALAAHGIDPWSGLEPVKAFYTGATFRMATAAGYVYFKAVSPAFIREPALTEALARWAGRMVPAPLAVDARRRWMLTRAVEGIELGASADPEDWQRTLQTYGRLQVAFATDGADRPLEHLYDWRTEGLARNLEGFVERLDALLEGYSQPLTGFERDELVARVPEWRRRCEFLARIRVPDSIEHGDLHAENVRLTSEGPVFLDWSWSGVTHPFVGAVRLLRDARTRWNDPDVELSLREAYLAEWRAFESPDRLVAAYDAVVSWMDLLHAVSTAEWVAALRACLPAEGPAPGTYLDWVLRTRQRFLADVLRRLLEAPTIAPA